MCLVCAVPKLANICDLTRLDLLVVEKFLFVECTHTKEGSRLVRVTFRESELHCRALLPDEHSLWSSPRLQPPQFQPQLTHVSPGTTYWLPLTYCTALWVQLVFIVLRVYFNCIYRIVFCGPAPHHNWTWHSHAPKKRGSDCFEP